MSHVHAQKKISDYEDLYSAANDPRRKTSNSMDFGFLDFLKFVFLYFFFFFIN